ncbi:hypothetical protein ACFX13_047047 [Malus domestica]|uniref:RRM domain-containing protein n=1 Tax=Malus domestica TaxID=3750 RepID=A0A498J505_MALDO|nr:hypothetical protein DVH24_000531 [Malus domestica]
MTQSYSKGNNSYAIPSPCFVVLFPRIHNNIMLSLWSPCCIAHVTLLRRADEAIRWTGERDSAKELFLFIVYCLIMWMFIKLLLLKVTKYDLFRHFGRLGANGMQSVDVDKIEGKHYGYLEFRNLEYASLAIQKANVSTTTLDGQRIKGHCHIVKLPHVSVNWDAFKEYTLNKKAKARERGILMQERTKGIEERGIDNLGITQPGATELAHVANREFAHTTKPNA